MSRHTTGKELTELRPLDVVRTYIRGECKCVAHRVSVVLVGEPHLVLVLHWNQGVLDIVRLEQDLRHTFNKVASNVTVKGGRCIAWRPYHCRACKAAPEGSSSRKQHPNQCLPEPKLAEDTIQ